MLKELSTKTKLVIPIFSLIIVLTFLGAMIIVFNYSKIVSSSDLNQKIKFSNIISDTLHSLQKERGLSSGYVITKNMQFHKELQEQRKITDAYTRQLFRSLKKLECKHFIETTKPKLFELKNLQFIRANIDDFSFSSVEAIKNYSSINRGLLEVIVNVAKSSHLPKITENILSYINLLYLKEYSGVERAQGIRILSQKTAHRDDIIHFSNLIALSEQNKMMFLQYATKGTKKYYEEITKLDVFQKVDTLEKHIINQTYLKNPIDSMYWYDTVTQEIDLYDRLSKYIKHDTTTKILQELQDTRNFFILFILLTVLSLVIFIYMLIAILKLIKNEQRLRLVMDKYIITSMTDKSGRIIDASEAFCKISGYSQEELLGKSHNMVRHPDMPDSIFEELWATITQGKSWSGKIKNLRKDGGFYWVYANIEPLYDSKGVIDSYIAIRIDITQNELLTHKVLEEEQKNKKNDELMQQQHRLAQMGEMISMIAHQWRQPLSAITAATGVITLKARRDKLDSKTALEVAEKIKEFSMHLSSTIDDFRNFFKSNKTKVKTDYKKIVESVLMICESSLAKNNIKLSVEIDSLKEFETYENEIKQVLLNLIKNAEDALVEKNIENPSITLQIDDTILNVYDNAGGIPEDIMDKIFEPYFSTKAKKDGTGLGLYMSKVIVQDHCNGELSVNNDGDGAHFKIVLGESDD